MTISTPDYSKNLFKKGSPLRKKMLEDMVLQNLANSTQENYVRGVERLSNHYQLSPDQISEAQVREFIVFLKKKSGLSFDTIRVLYYGIHFFYKKVMGCKWAVFDLTKVPQPNHLPSVLSFEDIKKLLSYLRHPMYQALLTLIYACGLRLSECINLRVEDIDRSRMVATVKGKGSKYRNVPIPEHVLGLLRHYWRLKRPRPLLFPGQNGQPVSASSVRCAFRDALKKAKIKKKPQFILFAIPMRPIYWKTGWAFVSSRELLGTNALAVPLGIPI